MADNGATGIDYPYMQQWMQYQNFVQQQQQINPQAQGDANAAQKLLNAAGTTNAIGSSISGELAKVPVFGQLASTAVGAVTGSIAGIEDLIAAHKQKQEASSLTAQAKSIQAPPPNKYFQQKANADQFAATSEAPGWTQEHDTILQSLATHLRAINNSTHNGGQAAHAIAESVGLTNEGLDRLFAQNLQYQAKARENANKDLWDLGEQKEKNVQSTFENYQKPLFQQATALGNAATANQHTGINTLLNTATAVGTQLAKGGSDISALDKVMNYINNGQGGPNAQGTGGKNSPYNLFQTGWKPGDNPIWDAFPNQQQPYMVPPTGTSEISGPNASQGSNPLLNQINPYTTEPGLWNK